MAMLAGRSKTQPAPPSVVWETLTDPHRPGSRTWLTLELGELEPIVIDSQRPNRVVWSSLWPDRQDDRICFDIEADGEGSRLTWSLDVGGAELTDAQFDQMRHRINYLINGEMRLSFGQ